MAHLVQTMAYVGETPWHNLGQQLPANQPIDVWAREAGMDWTIRETPVRYMATESGTTSSVSDLYGEPMEFPDQKVLYRSDTKAPLSVVSDVHELANDGVLPVCFIFQGNIGVFDRKPQPTELFAQAKRLAYFPRGHLRTHSGVALGVEVKNLNGKIDRVDQLRPGPVEIVKAHRGLDGSQCPAPKAEELWWLLDESNQWKFTQNHTRTWLASEWLFHVDDLPIGMVRANTANQRHTPSTVKREARKLETQAMYASWQKAYRTLSKKRPGESDVWYSLQIAKDKKLNPLRRDANTIKKNMLT